MDKIDKLLAIEADMSRLRVLLGETIDRTEFKLRMDQLQEEYTFVKAQEDDRREEILPTYDYY